MRATGGKTVLRVMTFLCAGAALSACTTAQQTASLDAKSTSSKTSKVMVGPSKQVYTYTARDRDCLKRVMYFESQRSSDAGFLAVGSVIMNRLTSGIYPPTICGVVSQEKQFAPGVMTRKMDEATAPELEKTADEVLKGKRHPDVKEAMFFHRQGLRFSYDNMHYTASAGGNVFYEKRGDDGALQTAEPKPVDQYVLAFAGGAVQTPGLALAMEAASPAAQTESTVPAVAMSTMTTTPVFAAPSTSPAVATISVASTYKQAISPVITAEIAKASVAQAFDASYAVPQNPSSEDARTYSNSVTTGIPVTVQKPDGQKRPSLGQRADVVLAAPAVKTGMSYDNWATRTANW